MPIDVGATLRGHDLLTAAMPARRLNQDIFPERSQVVIVPDVLSLPRSSSGTSVSSLLLEGALQGVSL